MELPLQALLGHVLQGPIPVVVIVRAEVAGAFPDIRPGGAVEGEAHVVLATDPRHDLHLLETKAKRLNNFN